MPGPRESYSGGGRDDDRDYGQGGWGYSGYAREGEQPVDVNRRGDLGDQPPDPDVEREGRADLGFGRRRGEPRAFAGPFDDQSLGRALGERPEGRFRGRGPRGFTRSDGRLREDVCDRLTDAGDLDASEIEVQVKDGEVTLSGAVATRRDKHRAEDLAEAAPGVRHVQNNLRPKNAGVAPAL